MKLVGQVKVNAPVREETFEGRPHLVAPVVLLVHGVHNRLYYPPEELAKYPAAWNGVPVPVQHPIQDGQHVSANSPAVIEKQSVGRLFNVRYDTELEKLVGEVWVDIAKARAVSPQALEGLRNGLEVSTALWCDDDVTPGEWNGEEYDAIVRNIRPDHLALLPGGEGACNWTDGCGIRANARRALSRMAAALGLRLRREVAELVAAEMSHEDIREKLHGAIVAVTPGSPAIWIREVFDDRVIYELSEIGEPSELYQRSYAVSADEEVQLVGDSVQVREETSYVPVGEEDTRPAVNKQEEPEMKKDEAIKALIADKRTHFEATDEEWLKGLSEEQLKKLEPTCPDAMKPNEATPPAADPPAPKVEEPPKVEPKAEEKPVTVDDYIATAPAEIQSVLSRAIARDRAEKDELVKAILANKRNKFAETVLRAKDLDELEALAALGEVAPDYSGRAGGPAPVDDDAVPPMPKVFEKV